MDGYTATDWLVKIKVIMLILDPDIEDVFLLPTCYRKCLETCDSAVALAILVSEQSTCSPGLNP